MTVQPVHSLRALATEERRIHHRFIEVTCEPLSKPLRYIMKNMLVGKPPTENVSDYFERVKQKKVKFDRTQKEKIATDPSGDSFDVTFLFKLIQEYWDKVKDRNDPAWMTAGTLENCIKQIKDTRNDAFHATGYDKSKFDPKLKEVTTLLETTWKMIGSAFGTDTTNEIAEMAEDIKRIKFAPLDDLKKDLVDMQTLLKTQGVNSMKERYRTHLSQAPDMNLLDTDPANRTAILIEDVFTEMQVISNEGNEKQPVCYKDWLKRLDEAHAKQQASARKVSKFLLIDGLAGVGKTTLCKKMVLDWASESPSMDNLNSCDMIQYFQFREKNLESLPMLYLRNMPALNNEVHPEYVMMLNEGNTTTFLCDGLDEYNPATIQVFESILEYGMTHPITVVCSTRPQEIPRLLSMLPSEFSYLRVQVVGIPVNERGSFVEKYFRVLLPEENPFQLLHYLSMTPSQLRQHWRFPFNLICLVHLWALDRIKVFKLTTATELFVFTHEALLKKLEARQTIKSKTFHEDLQAVMSTFCDVALRTFGSGNIMLSSDSLQRLKNVCRDNNIDIEDVLSTFLTATVSWSDVTDYSYSFPHNALQDFYGAMSVLEKLDGQTQTKESTRSEMEALLRMKNFRPEEIKLITDKMLEVNEAKAPVSLRNILEDITDGGQKVGDTIIRAQNLLTHVTGLAFHKKSNLSNDIYWDIFQLLQESGIDEPHRWLDLLEITKCDERICRFVAKKLGYQMVMHIMEDQIGPYASILPYKVIQTDHSAIDIQRDPEELPRLPELLRKIQKKTLLMSLIFHHDLRHPKKGENKIDEVIQTLIGNIQVFKGQLSPKALKQLQPNLLRSLKLSVAEEAQYIALKPYIYSAKLRGYSRLDLFGLHIPATTVDLAVLEPLPHIRLLNLYISGLDEEQKVDWAVKAVRALHPTRNIYRLLVFEGFGNRIDLLKLLLEGLAPEEGLRRVHVSRIHIMMNISPEDLQELQGTAKRNLRCQLSAHIDRTWYYF